MVIGDGQVGGLEHFSPAQRLLQKLGSWTAQQSSVPITARHTSRLADLARRASRMPL
jgi:hypothetical protein